MATPIITHAKVSGKPQGSDSTRVYGNHWDANHVVSGLENVDNTSDVNKPVSTAQAAADAVVAANAANATNLTSGTLPAPRMPALTGDVISTVGTVATTLATVNANVGTFGSATQSIQATFNAKGLLTAAANVTIAPSIGSITGLGTSVATALGVNVGTAGSVVVNGGALGTPSSGALTSCTGLPISTGVSGLGTGVATALAINVGSAGAPVTFNGALGTPSSGTATNLSGLPIGTGISGLGTGIATWLATPSSANLRAALTDEVGTGAAYFVGGALGTPASGTATNLSGLPLSGLTTQAAYTFIGNNSGSTAVPTAVDIAALTTKGTPAAGDYVILSDQAASGAWKKATVSSVGAASGVSSIAGNTGAFTLSNGLTNSTNDIRLNIGHLPGETTTGTPAAGEIGELVTSAVAGTVAALTTATTANVTSVTLTAGDWDVSGMVNFGGGGGTSTTDAQSAISTSSAQLVTGNIGMAAHNRHASTADLSVTHTFVPVRVSISGSATYFLNAQATFSGGSYSATGVIRARRMR